jgi:hypothetical protein
MPVALRWPPERLSLLPDGRLLYRLKHRWRDGTTHVIYEPLELMERLAALVPPPRFNLTRYSGVLAPAAAFRPLVVPTGEAPSTTAHAGCRGGVSAAKSDSGAGGRETPPAEKLSVGPTDGAGFRV